ncbi:hypothetical protein GBA52_024969 [Prunus armeniaca]|nr:hypothetical protein GBA52_024969 [Prunus armeniaca]
MKGVWFGGNLSYRINHQGITNISHWFANAIGVCTNNKERLSTKVVFEHVAKRCLSTKVLRWKQLFEPSLRSPPTGNTIKVNVDAAWNPRSGLVGIGILLRDSQSRFLAAMTTITNAISALDAKALALLWGCKFVEERCKILVDIEFDSKCVI